MSERELPQEVLDALKELREFNHKKSADILEDYILSTPREITREQWLEVIKDGALSDPEHGWLSDLGNWELNWSDFDEAIVLGYHEGSIDIGHLVGFIQYTLENGPTTDEY